MSKELTIYGAERAAVVEQLAFAPTVAPEVAKALALLENPDAANLSFSNILKKVGCTNAMFTAALRDAKIAQRHAETLEKMWDKMPDAMGDMVNAAISRDEPCICTRTIDGKIIPPSAACKDCQGRGLIRYRADAERHRLVAEATGILKKGPAVSVTTQIAAPTFGIGGFDKMVKATDAAMEKLLMPTTDPPIDAEVILNE